MRHESYHQRRWTESPASLVVRLRRWARLGDGLCYHSEKRQMRCTRNTGMRASERDRHPAVWEKNRCLTGMSGIVA